MKYVVVGAGATGAAIGGYLAIGGAEVWLVDPNEEHMRVCREECLTIQAACVTSGSELKEYNIKMNATTNAEEAGVADVVIFMPKGPFTRAAMPNALKVSDEHTIFLTLQNGLGNVEIISEYINVERIAYGITTMSSGMPKPGTVTPRLQPKSDVWVGSDNKELRDILEQVAADFRAGGLDAGYDDNIMLHIWEKFTMNCAVNALTSVLRMNGRNANQFQDTIDIRRGIVTEIYELAKKEGYEMDPDTIRMNMKAMPVDKSITPATYSSMAQDALHKRQTEIENLNGYVVAEAKRFGMSVPYNEVITKLVRVIQQGYDLQF